MLTITIGGQDAYDEAQQRFVKDGGIVVQLEHSLVSLSKWESKWEVPFLGDTEKTTEQTLSYIECMNLTPDIPPEVFQQVSDKNIAEINAYVDAKMTATWFQDKKRPPGRREVITNELVYYWMTALSINWEAQYWHLNRLLTLVRVCNEKNEASSSKSKKVTAADKMRERAALNEERQAKLKTSG